MLVPKLRFKCEDGTNYPDWVSGTIGDYYVFKNGLNKEKTAFGQGTPIVNYTDVFKNRLLTSKIIKGRVTLSDKEIENHSAVYGDVFFTRTSETLDEVGFCGALIEDISNCVFSGFLLRGRPIDLSAVSPHFAGYYFMTSPIRQEIISKSSITTRALTNGRNLSAVNIKLPCLEEQQKIADFLSNVDDVISQSEAEVRNLKQQKKAAMQKIFSQEVRFKREDGTEFPEWEEKKIGAVFSRFATGLNPRDNFVLNAPNSSNYYVTIKNFEHGKLNLDENCDLVTDEAIKLINKRSNLKKDDILMSSIGRVGDCYLITETPMNWNINESVFVLRPDTEIVFPAYAFHTIHSDIVLNSILKQITGSTFKSIKMAQLKSTNMPIPCLEEQQKIADFLSSYDEAITYAKQELEHWKQIKKGLLQQMFV